MRYRQLTKRIRLEAFMALVFAQAEHATRDLTPGEEVAVIQRVLIDRPMHVCEHLRRVVQHVWSVPRLFPLFTELLQKLMEANVSAEQGYEDVALWGAPSECNGDVRRMYEDDVRSLLKDYCATPEFVYGEAKRRGISDKWMYENLPPIEFDSEGRS